MSISSYDINMMLRMLKNGRADWGNSIFVRRMSEEDVLDFKAINPNCEFFTEEEKFVNFLKGDEDGAETTLYFIVRDVDRITMEDKRIVIEELGSDSTKVYRYGWCNVLKKRLSQESLEDFKALNPKCEVFKDYKKFKKFIRDVKINQNASIWQDDAGITRMDDAGASRQTSQKKSSQQYSQSSAGSSKDAPKLSEEEMLELEYQHDEEMFQRKFGNKKKRK